MNIREKTISAIIPCYNEGRTIPVMYKRLVAVFGGIGCKYEIVFVDDGSPDGSEAVLRGLAAKDPRVVVVLHSRSFSSQNAFMSGMQVASGDAVVLLDADLQDPPEVIPQFVKKWLEGNEVVYGVRVKREATRFLQLAYKLFYRILSRMSYIKIPEDAGDFSLMDRKIVDILVSMPERDMFVRGLRAWVGFRQTGVPYVRPERLFGTTSNNLRKNIRWAKKGLFSFSYEPLELIFYLALAVAAVTFFSVVGYIALYFLYPDQPRGITTVIVLVLFFGSVQLMSVSIVGEYLGRIFEEVKGRPKSIIKEIINNPRL